MKVQTSGEEYEIKSTNGTHTEFFQDGPKYLKVLISKITIDSGSTVTYIRGALSESDKHMGTFDNNVTTFNDLVQLQLNALKAKGKSNYIMVNLFKGFKSVLIGSSSSTLSRK